MKVSLQNVLDRYVMTPALVRKMKRTGTLKVKDGAGQVIRVEYEKTQAGYINFTNADETIQLKVPNATRSR